MSNFLSGSVLLCQMRAMCIYVCVHVYREAQRTTYFGEETDPRLASSQGEAGNSGDPISS